MGQTEIFTWILKDMLQVNFRRICVESSEHNVANFLLSICSNKLNFGKETVHLVLFDCPAQLNNFFKLVFVTSCTSLLHINCL